MTRDGVQNRATGAFFLVGFGSVWTAAGCAQTHHGSAASWAALAAVCVCLLTWVNYLMRQSHDLPPAEPTAEEQVRMQRMFTAVNIILWVSVATAVSVLGLLHMPEYIVPAISMLVGLHLLPLAGAFRNQGHYLTGALLLGWPLCCLALLPRLRVSGVCASGAGALLLLSAAMTLAYTASELRMRQPERVIVRS